VNDDPLVRISKFIGYMIGLFDGMLMRQEPAT